MNARPTQVRPCGRPASARWLPALACGFMLSGVVIAGTAEPFKRLRDATLSYHGPAADFENLTELRIGWFGPSDPADPVHGDFWWAANFAVQQANAASAAGQDSTQPLPVRLVPRWSVEVWAAGVTQLTRMVYDEKPLALLGSVDSASTHLAEQVVAKANLPLVSPVATDPSLTLAGVSWMFSCPPADPAVAETLVTAALDATSRPRRPCVVLSTTDHESRMTAREVIREFTRRERLPDLRLEVTAGTTDLSHVLEATRAAAPVAIVVIAGPEDAARLTQALRAELRGAMIIGGPGLARHRFVALAGAAAEDVRVPLLFDATEGDAVTREFVAVFQRERGHAPDYAAAMTYDACRMLVECVRQAGANRARIRNALASVTSWPGIAGSIGFDGTGQNPRGGLALGRIVDGQVTRFR